MKRFKPFNPFKMICQWFDDNLDKIAMVVGAIWLITLALWCAVLVLAIIVNSMSFVGYTFT